MKNNTIVILKKECTRIFSDRKLFFMAVIIPGLLIFLLYSMMGNLIHSMYQVNEGYVYQVNVINLPESAPLDLFSELGIEIKHISESEAEAVRQQINDRETDLLIIFPKDFDEQVAVFDVSTSLVHAPNVQIWANTARSESAEVYLIIKNLLEQYHHSLTHRFSINAPSEESPDGEYDLATLADFFVTFMGSIITMVFLIFIFSGCQAIAPESIAGEKERGTLGTILVTPTKRRDMAFAKILSISFFGVLSATGSMIGIALSLPKMMNMGDAANTFNFYGISDYILILGIAVSTTLVFVSLMSITSAISKSVKEASAYTMPFMVISMVCGLASLITGGVPAEVFWYLIPLFNSALCFTAILQFNVSAVNILITVAANVALTMICVGVLARIFNSEKIVFDK